MQPTSNINNPDGMDELLKKAFLDLDMSKTEDSMLMDEMAQHVMQSDMFANNTNTKNNIGKTLKVKSWVWYLSACSILLCIVVAAVVLFNKSDLESPITKKENSTTKELTEQIENLQDLEISQKQALDTNVTLEVREDNYKGENVNKGVNKENFVVVKNETKSIFNQENNLIIEQLKNNFEIPVLNKLDSSNICPQIEKPIALLTKEELAQHKKQMKALQDSYAGQRIEDYTLIQIEGKNPTVSKDHYLKEGEVSVKEYKLFLTDLLAEGKASQYEKAKPKFDKVWTDKKDKMNKRLLEVYFKSEKYENYPMLCITVEGMEMYCNWLQEKLNSFYTSKNEKLKFTVRLPEIQEWKYAASSGKPKHVYGTRNGKLKSSSWSHLIFVGRYWNANFIETQPKFLSKNDTLDDSINEKHIETTRRLNKESFTHMIRSNFNEKMQLYNMSGNVSEIVYFLDDSGKKVFRSIGGNWNSTKDFLKIEAEDEFNGNIEASPYIGFRPVINVEK